MEWAAFNQQGAAQARCEVLVQCQVRCQSALHPRHLGTGDKDAAGAASSHLLHAAEARLSALQRRHLQAPCGIACQRCAKSVRLGARAPLNSRLHAVTLVSLDAASAGQNARV